MAATFAGYLAWLLLSTPTTSDIVVLARDLPAGSALSRIDLAEVEIGGVRLDGQEVGQKRGIGH